MFEPKLIEVKGVQFVNKGAELMLHAVIQKVAELWPDASIVLAPNPYSPYQARANVNAFQKLSLRKNRLDLNLLSYKLPGSVRRYLKHNWGVITEADIDLVLDASGFAYGDQWGSLKVKHLAGELQRYKKHGIPYVFLPQALGPFTRESDVKHLKTALPKATFIAARESTSYQHVQKLVGDASNLHKFPDFTNLVTGFIPDYYENGSQKVLFIPNSNMVGERNTHKPEWKDQYVAVFAKAINFVSEAGYTPVLLNHEGKGDGDLCQEIRNKSGLPVNIIEETHPLAVKGIIGASKGVICSRFHGCVSALCQAVPCLGTSWSHKYERLFEGYNVSECLLEPDFSSSELENKIKALLSGEFNTEKKANSQKKVSEELWDKIVATLNQVEK